MKRWIVCLLACCFLFGAGALGEEKPLLLPDRPLLEPDEALFASFCERFGYSPPEGMVLETQAICHLTFDGEDDLAVSLVSADGKRRSFCILATEDEERIILENPNALPDPGAADQFLGFSNDPVFVIHVVRERDPRETRSFRLTSSAGDIVLAEVSTLVAAPGASAGRLESLDFMEGIYTQWDIAIDGEAYQGVAETRREEFDPAHIPIDTFDLDDFPVFFEDYQAFMTAEAGRVDFIRCQVCLQMVPGGEMDHHACPTVQRLAAPISYCDVCCFWFESAGFSDHYCVGRKKTAYCEACDQWFAPGREIRDHECVGFLYSCVE